MGAPASYFNITFSQRTPKGLMPFISGSGIKLNAKSILKLRGENSADWGRSDRKAPQGSNGLTARRDAP